ncbi:MAG: hypothetical protein ACE5OY_06835 [Candidatus Bathyarchaeia archaeon]
MEEFNAKYIPEISKNRDIKIVDSTLREGEQAAGVAFRPEEKLKIALYDDEIGIDVIEIFAPSYSRSDAATLELIQSAGLSRSELMLWNRLRREDIDLSLKHDPGWVAMCVGFSDIHLNEKLRKGREEVAETCIELIDYVHDHGTKASLHMEDSTRTELKHLADVVQNLNADKFRDCDTLSMLLPQSAYHRIRYLTSSTKKPLEVHYHNDRGMALANSISGMLGGASWISSTWNGIGDRAGNAPTEEVLLLLTELYGIERFDLPKTIEVCDFVSDASRVPIPRFKPITGRDVFTIQSGIHQDGMLKHKGTYQPFAPEIVRRNWKFVIGSTSGRTGLDHVLNHEFGYRLPDDEKRQIEILEWAKKRAAEKKSYLSEKDLREMIRRFDLQSC